MRIIITILAQLLLVLELSDALCSDKQFPYIGTTNQFCFQTTFISSGSVDCTTSNMNCGSPSTLAGVSFTAVDFRSISINITIFSDSILEVWVVTNGDWVWFGTGQGGFTTCGSTYLPPAYVAEANQTGNYSLVVVSNTQAVNNEVIIGASLTSQGVTTAPSPGTSLSPTPSPHVTSSPLMSSPTASPIIQNNQAFIQQGPKLVGNDTQGTSSRLGTAVALNADGTTALVGGDYDNNLFGAIWVFTRTTGNVWTQQGPKLVGTGSSGTVLSMGNSVALSADGNTALIGGCSDNHNWGAVWIFTRTGDVWSQQGTKLTPTDMFQSGFFGTSVSLSADGNTALTSAPGDNSTFSGPVGAVWVFIRVNGTWTQQGTKLVGTGSTGPAAQGVSLSLSADGNTALVGGPADNNSIGAAWVFVRVGGTWSQEGTKLVGSGHLAPGQQGHSVAISGDGNTALLGAYDDNNIGAVWVFTRIGGVWNQEGPKLIGSGVNPNQSIGGMGLSVALSVDGNIALVGIGKPLGVPQPGAALIFTRTQGVWSQQGNYIVENGNVGDASFGYSVALSSDGKTALIGGNFDNSETGAAWAFTILNQTASPSLSPIHMPTVSPAAPTTLCPGPFQPISPTISEPTVSPTITKPSAFPLPSASPILTLKTPTHSPTDIAVAFNNSISPPSSPRFGVNDTLVSCNQGQLVVAVSVSIGLLISLLALWCQFREFATPRRKKFSNWWKSWKDMIKMTKETNESLSTWVSEALLVCVSAQLNNLQSLYLADGNVSLAISVFSIVGFVCENASLLTAKPEPRAHVSEGEPYMAEEGASMSADGFEVKHPNKITSVPKAPRRILKTIIRRVVPTTLAFTCCCLFLSQVQEQTITLVVCVIGFISVILVFIAEAFPCVASRVPCPRWIDLCGNQAKIHTLALTLRRFCLLWVYIIVPTCALLDTGFFVGPLRSAQWTIIPFAAVLVISQVCWTGSREGPGQNILLIELGINIIIQVTLMVQIAILQVSGTCQGDEFLAACSILSGIYLPTCLYYYIQRAVKAAKGNETDNSQTNRYEATYARGGITEDNPGADAPEPTYAREGITGDEVELRKGSNGVVYGPGGYPLVANEHRHGIRESGRFDKNISKTAFEKTLQRWLPHRSMAD